MVKSLEVVVDGIIFQGQSQGGISRIFSEILPRMCDMDESLRIKLFTIGKVRQALPAHVRISHHSIPHVERYLRPRRTWKSIAPRARELVRRAWIGRGGGQIWHSTYYTLPQPWDGLQVVTVHDMIHERFADMLNRPGDDQFREKKRCCVQRSDAMICVSETTRQDLQHFYKLDSARIHLIPHGYSGAFKQLQQLDNGLEILTKRPFLLYVGNRTHYKNFHRLILAYSVWVHRKEVALVVVGKPWSAAEECRLVELEIQDSVRLLADIDDEALCRLYNQAAAFIYPSLYEGFGIPLLEAMACGCPVIASRIPSTIEVAAECPIYFEPSEVESLLAAFDVALSEGRDSERVRAGLQRVQCYSWEKTARQTLDVYHAILRSGTIVVRRARGREEDDDAL